MNMEHMRVSPVVPVILAVFFLIVIIGGCLDQRPVAGIENNRSGTEPQTFPATESAKDTRTSVPIEDTTDDKNFVDAAEACFRATPGINNISAHTAFVRCMQNTPDPASPCAQSYRRNVLKYTNEDSTTSGFDRETHNVNLFRSAFFKNLTYNATLQEFEPCK